MSGLSGCQKQNGPGDYANSPGACHGTEGSMPDNRSPRQEMQIMGRAFAEAMGRKWADDCGAPIGSWSIRRCDTDRPLYQLVEHGEHGSISHPISSVALTAQGMADALYFARLAVGVERQP